MWPRNIFLQCRYTTLSTYIPTPAELVSTCGLDLDQLCRQPLVDSSLTSSLTKCTCQRHPQSTKKSHSKQHRSVGQRRQAQEQSYHKPARVQVQDRDPLRGSITSVFERTKNTVWGEGLTSSIRRAAQLIVRSSDGGGMLCVLQYW